MSTLLARIGAQRPLRRHLFRLNRRKPPDRLAGFASRCFRFEQLLDRPKGGEVISQKFVVFDPDSQVAFQKRNEANEPERVDMKRFVRVANGGQRRARLVQIIFQLLRVLPFFYWSVQVNKSSTHHYAPASSVPRPRPIHSSVPSTGESGAHSGRASG